MQPDHIVVVGKREYLQRVKSRAFWIATLILPLFVTAISLVPALLISKTRSSQKLVVVDETGRLGAGLVAKLNARGRAAAKEAQAKPAQRTRDEEKMVQFVAT